ncbi:hypothetical protein OG21DRAFT_1606045, partial [Imleria badia]
MLDVNRTLPYNLIPSTEVTSLGSPQLRGLGSMTLTEQLGRIVVRTEPDEKMGLTAISSLRSETPNGLDPTVPSLAFASQTHSLTDAQRYRTSINSKQLPVNCPFNLNSVANFLRDGTNQGTRPNFWSQQDMLNLEVRPYNDDNHTIWVGGAINYLSTPTEQDLELPRIF